MARRIDYSPAGQQGAIGFERRYRQTVAGLDSSSHDGAADDGAGKSWRSRCRGPATCTQSNATAKNAEH